MAVFVPGVSCSLCGRPIGNAPVLLPPFVANRRDPLYALSDGVFHRECFEQHPLAEEARRYSTLAVQAGVPGQRKCLICGLGFEDPDDYFGTGLLTRDTRHKAFEFNFVHLHRSHWDTFDRRSEFRSAVIDIQQPERWNGPRVVFKPLPTWVAG